MTFNFGLAEVCSPALFETRFCSDKDIKIAATDYMHLHNLAISIDSYSPINKFSKFLVY